MFCGTTLDGLAVMSVISWLSAYKYSYRNNSNENEWLLKVTGGHMRYKSAKSPKDNKTAI